MLAKHLSLSVATVSKALADSHEIRQSTKTLVIEGARELGYVGNPYASSLRKRASKTIAVVLPEVADSFFSEAINGIESVALQEGYHVLIYLTHEHLAREQAIMEEFKSGRVDGVLVSVSEETGSGEHIRRVLDSGTPVVFFDRVCDGPGTACVITDDFESSYRAVVHLAASGCRQPTFLATPTNLSISMNRLKGFEKALADLGLPRHKDEVLIFGKNEAENMDLLRAALSQPRPPDGMLVCVEKHVTYVYQLCAELRICIPDALKVIAFTNLKTAQFMSPPLTTVSQPAFEIGKTAAAALFRALKRASKTIDEEVIVIKSALVKRESTGSSPVSPG
ncbi:LacI family DNA-binding transcriptional regulator [Hufsiella ginkgonis]|nr:LacI family DNA-binding transcriptional regulator [Hufsiella ginkgonis]